MQEISKKGDEQLKKMIQLFSHRLTDEQQRDAVEHWQIGTFIPLPDELQKLWSQIPANEVSIVSCLEPFKRFLSDHCRREDVVLVQGDFGATCHMVGYIRTLGAVPVYATTRREIQEVKTEEGIVQKRSVFQHRRFREYV